MQQTTDRRHVQKKKVFNFDLKVVREFAERMCRGRRFQTSSAALVKVRWPALVPSPVGMVSWHFVAERSPCLPGCAADHEEARRGDGGWLGSQNLVGDQRDLVLDALLDRQPVQVLEYRCHVVAEVRTCHGSS